MGEPSAIVCDLPSTLTEREELSGHAPGQGRTEMRWSCKLTILVLGLVGLGLASLGGCRSDGSSLFAPPGSVAKQRSNAIVHDPVRGQRDWS